MIFAVNSIRQRTQMMLQQYQRLCCLHQLYVKFYDQPQVSHRSITTYLSVLPLNSNYGSGKVSILQGINRPLCIPWSVVQTRMKSKKRTKRVQEDDTDDEDEEEEMDDDEELEKGKDFKDLKLTLSSLRLDTVIHKGLNMTRRKVEEAFYASNIRVNGKKILKKSMNVEPGDELDVIKCTCTYNPELLEIMRLVVLSCQARQENQNFVVKLRQFKHMVVYKYEDEWTN